TRPEAAAVAATGATGLGGLSSTMQKAELYLFDDAVARNWQPFSLTRPIGELLYGAHTFRARAERLLSIRCAGHVTASHLGGFEEPGAAPVIRLDDIPTD